MAKTSIQKATPELLKEYKVDSWQSWDCGPSEFPWEYSTDEICYVKKGKVIVIEENGEKVEINAGEIVIFPKGLKCTWKVIERIEKVYNFILPRNSFPPFEKNNK